MGRSDNLLDVSILSVRNKTFSGKSSVHELFAGVIFVGKTGFKVCMVSFISLSQGIKESDSIEKHRPIKSTLLISNIGNALGGPTVFLSKIILHCI